MSDLDLFGQSMPMTPTPERHTEASMIARLNRRYAKTYRNGSYIGRRYSRAEKVATSAGFAGRGSRIADYIATDIYSPTWAERTKAERVAGIYDGLGSIIGHEIKVSRSDWLTELRDPTKAEAWARYCHCWWLVAPPEVVRDDLPDGWGLLVPWRDSLRAAVRPTRRDPEPMPGHIVASLARAIVRTETNLPGGDQ